MVKAAKKYHAEAEPIETFKGADFDTALNKGPKQHIGEILEPQGLAKQAKDLSKDVHLEYVVPKQKSDFAFNYVRNMNAN